jgi:hypothetical protein
MYNNKLILKWVTGVILILGGLGELQSYELITSLFHILAGCICLPPLYNFIETKTKIKLQSWQKYVTVIGLFLIGGIFIKNQKPNVNNLQNVKYSKDSVIINSNQIVRNDSLNKLSKDKLAKLNYTYRILEVERVNPSLENFNVEINCKEISKENIEFIARQIKSEVCKNDCNLSVWENEKYFTMDKLLDKEKYKCYENVIDNNVIKNCVKEVYRKYYVNVADHLYAIMFFGGPNDVYYFPYRDSMYYEFGGKY